MLLEMIREGLLYLKRRELPETAKKDLVIYLPPKLRKKVIQEEQVAHQVAPELQDLEVVVAEQPQ